jgi:hypothetical protein
MAQTAKQQAAQQRRSLRAIRKKLSDLGRAWDGVDGHFEGRLWGLHDEIEQIETELTEFIIEGEKDGNL